jgi:hypothetical protein
MAGEYVSCESEAKMSLCMSVNCMCHKFCDKIRGLTESKRIECAIYAFTGEGLIKYGYNSKIRNLNEGEVGKITLI